MDDAPGRFARLPTRVRVTLAYTGAMAVLLAAAAVVLSWQFGRDLRAEVDRGLRSRADGVRALVLTANGRLAASPAVRGAAVAIAQVVTPRAEVVDTTPDVRGRRLLSVAEAARAARGAAIFEHAAQRPTDPDRTRFLGMPVTRRGQRAVLVVGASLEPALDAQNRLRTLLLVGTPIALLLAALAGYGAAAGALRPVELMRRRASEIQAGRLGQRLPVAPARDEVARLGETLNAMLAGLEQAFERERRFVADASHELRTPLAVLQGELELALRDARDVEGYRAAVMSAAEEADRLTRLAEDLLVIARADQGRLPVRRAPVAVSRLLGELERRFAGRAAAEGVALRVDGGADLRLDVDELRLGQALGNLVDNALRHGGRSVEVTAARAGDRIELRVRDDGPGFDASVLPVAFNRFTRGDAARSRGGAGLGLAIVRAVAEAHDGTAHAVSGPGRGADVWLDLPA